MRLDQIGNVLAAGRAWKLAGSGHWRGRTVKDQFGAIGSATHAHTLALLALTVPNLPVRQGASHERSFDFATLRSG